MSWRARTLFVANVVLLACGSTTNFGDDGGGSDSSVSDASSDVSDSSVSFGDAGIGDSSTDVSCGLGSAGSFATQSSLDLFGQTVFFADGGALPAGHYRIEYVDGCMKYSSTQDWTVNAYAEDAGNDHWWLVDGPGDEAGTKQLLMPPGTTGYLVQGGAYSTFAECVTGNLQLDAPREFDFAGGQLGLWLADYPYSDNLAGESGRNPKWALTIVGQPCPK